MALRNRIKLVISYELSVVKNSPLSLFCVIPRYDSRVKAMEVDERPTEQYSDIGGLDKQIQEVGVTFSRHRIAVFTFR